MASVSDEKDFELDELFALARLALERNDVEGALRKLKVVVRGKKAPTEAIALTARVYAQLRLFDRAEELFRRYLEMHPKAVLERFQLGMTRFDNGKPEPALEVWEAVLKDQPEFPPALYFKGLALSQLGRSGEAKPVLEALLRSASADNLYFGRAKELLQAIESGRAISVRRDGGNGSGSEKLATAVPPDAYRTEH